MTVELTERDAAMLGGDMGEAPRMAMRLLLAFAEAMDAPALLDISGAHIDGCLVVGQSSVDLAETLRDKGGSVVVPTTLNITNLDLLHPELYRGDEETAALSRRLIGAYEDMGCTPSWTCAPYQLPTRPGIGEHIAWAESNATAFANSVLGARSERYGDFIDICCAITGRAPAAGLHLDQNRRAEVVVSVEGLSEELLSSEVLFPVLGFAIGKVAGTRVPVVTGIPTASEDQLKALCASASSSGVVPLLHVAGVTPEAPTVDAALGGRTPTETIRLGPGELRLARDELSHASAERLASVSLGTPHYSAAQLTSLATLMGGRSVHADVDLYVNTGRDVLASIGDVADELTEMGVKLVTDTCTYVTPIMEPKPGFALTDSAKWAYYAPGNLGVEVVFGSVSECVESAVHGRLVRDEALWS